MHADGSVVDRHARPLGVLRLSLTGRCNLLAPIAARMLMSQRDCSALKLSWLWCSRPVPWVHTR